jgi:hypothetical protein
MLFGWLKSSRRRNLFFTTILSTLAPIAAGGQETKIPFDKQLLPDLDLVCFLTTAPNAAVGDSYVTEIRIVNSGSAPAPASHAAIYLTPDLSFDKDADHRLEEKSVPALDPGEEATIRWTFTVPDLAAGSYDVWGVALLDTRSEVLELVEGNGWISTNTLYHIQSVATPSPTPVPTASASPTATASPSPSPSPTPPTPPPPDADGDGILDSYEVEKGTNHADSSSKPTLGDADGSGSIDNVDGIITLMVFLEAAGPEVEVDPEDLDVNLDGRVDSVDAIIQFNYYLGNVPYLPFG